MFFLSLILLSIFILVEKPHIGKHLEKELSGYFSLRAKRFRIIYKINEENQIIEIHYVGHRKDIYELLKKKLGDAESISKKGGSTACRNAALIKLRENHPVYG